MKIGDRMVLAHRFSYEIFIGPIPDGMTVDHIACNFTSCCNPDHLRVCSNRENGLRGNSAAAQNARKTHCVNGHEFTPENTRTTSERRRCRRCKAASERRRRLKRQ
jgi:hypothetical protein